MLSVYVLSFLVALQIGTPLKTPKDTVESTEKTSATQSKQRGSDSLPVVVKLLNTGQSKEYDARDSIRIEIEHGVAVSTLRWTKILGAIAFVQSMIFVLQLIVFSIQAKRLHETVDMMKRQEKLTSDTIGRIDREFIAGHPPRIVTRRVYWNDPGGTGDPSQVNGPKIFFTIANMGQSRADIVNCTVVKWVNENRIGGLPRAGLEGAGEEKGPFVLAPGEHKHLGYGETRAQLKDELYRNMLAPDASVPPYKSDHTLWLLGNVKFRDENGTLRQIAFCHRYDANQKRFSPDNDPDYSYNYTY